jgi:hypothetical protein
LIRQAHRKSTPMTSADDPWNKDANGPVSVTKDGLA